MAELELIKQLLAEHTMQLNELKAFIIHLQQEPPGQSNRISSIEKRLILIEKNWE